MKTMNFGEHLTLDGYGGSSEALGSRERVLRTLEELVSRLEMKKLSEPMIVEATGNTPKDSGGWSGFVIIEESHISIHTFPHRQFVSADIYTCKNGMDTDVATEYLRDAFSLKDVETHFIRRGTQYPADDIV